MSSKIYFNTRRVSPSKLLLGLGTRLHHALAPAHAKRTASKLLLKPYDLDFEDLDKVFGKLFRHKLDYADLYFQYHRSEAWSLEEGIVKSGSFNIEQGVGVRADQRADDRGVAGDLAHPVGQDREAGHHLQPAWSFGVCAPRLGGGDGEQELAAFHARRWVR